MSKIALCFHGLSGGRNFKNGGLIVDGDEAAYNIYQNFILPLKEKFYVDVFYHTWSGEDRDTINEVYKPVEYHISESRTLYVPSVAEKIKLWLINKLLRRDESRRGNNIYSRWFSLVESLRIVGTSNVSYDYVFVLRFDMVFKTKFDPDCVDLAKVLLARWRKYKVNGREVKDEDLGKTPLSGLKEIPHGYPVVAEHGLHDFIFGGPADYMLGEFALIYEQLSHIINRTGMSNHEILKYKLQTDGRLEDAQYPISYPVDITLKRWI